MSNYILDLTTCGLATQKRPTTNVTKLAPTVMLDQKII